MMRGSSVALLGTCTSFDMQTFPAHIWRDIEGHVETTYPLEASGIVVKHSSGAWEVRPSPPGTASRYRYEIPAALLLSTRDRQETIHAFYHSHPDGPPRASSSDLGAMHAGKGPSWPGVDWLIVGTRASQIDAVRQFWWDEKTSSYSSKLIGS